MIRRGPTLIGIAAIAFALAGCSSAAAKATGSTTTTTATSTTTTTATSTTTTTATSTTTTTVRSAANTPPRCQTSKLDIWGDPTPGGGYAGGYGYTINFTDFGGACTLFGYPG